MKQNQENQPAADISFEIGFGKEKTRFDLKFIAVADETRTQQRFNDIADSDAEKEAKEFQICLDALVEFSNTPEAGAALREKFSAMTARNERIIRGAYQQFRLALSPEIDFLSR